MLLRIIVFIFLSGIAITGGFGQTDTLSQKVLKLTRMGMEGKVRIIRENQVIRYQTSMLDTLVKGRVDEIHDLWIKVDGRAVTIAQINEIVPPRNAGGAAASIVGYVFLVAGGIVALLELAYFVENSEEDEEFFPVLMWPFLVPGYYLGIHREVYEIGSKWYLTVEDRKTPLPLQNMILNSGQEYQVYVVSKISGNVIFYLKDDPLKERREIKYKYIQSLKKVQ